MQGRWRRRGAAALVAVVVSTVLGFAGEPASAAAAGAERAGWVQGDSVLLGAVDTVRARLADWDAEVAAFVGLNTRGVIQVFRDRQADLGSVVVVEVGLNDWGMSSEAYGRLIDELMGVVGNRHVIWLTSSRFRAEMDGVNGAIRAAAARHANYEVLEWGPLSDAHPEATYDDGIHLRPVGQQMLADAIDAALERWWGRRCPVSDVQAAASVSRLYRAYFLRDPDPAGHEYWAARYRNGELCLSDISEYFAASGEFIARYGALDIPDFVRLVYLNVLGREPDPEGYNHWAVQLTYGGMRRGEMMIGFSESPEFRARSGIA